MRTGNTQKSRSRIANGNPEAPLQPELLDVERFAGAGGMGVGLKAAGFSPCRFYEADPTCCRTLTQNLNSPTATLRGRVYPGLAEQIHWRPLHGNVRLLAAGAPCQP